MTLQELANTVLQQALPGLETLLAALGSLILFRATAFIQAHVHNTVVAGILNRLTAQASTVVSEAEGTLVEQFRTNGAPLTKEQGKLVLDAVLAKLKTHLGPQGLAEIEKIVRPGDLNTLLVSYIEAANQNLNPPPAAKL